MREVNRRTDRRILKIFLPGLRNQREIVTDFLILQLQRIANSSVFWARIWTLLYFCPDFGLRAKMEERIWLINHNGSADLYTPIGRFYTKDALSVWTNLGKHFVVRLGYASLV